MAKEMRKVRTGAVVRAGMEQTAVVEMVWKQRHRLYRKPMRRVTRFYVHDPLNQCRVGDMVRIQETRPISKTKRWRLLEILHRRQLADVQPIELETDIDAAIAEPAAEVETAADAVAEVEAVEEPAAEAESVTEVAAEVETVEEPVAEVETAAEAADGADAATDGEETAAEPVAAADTPATAETEAAAESAVAEAGEEKDA